jgi:hypothetical protein
MAVRLLTQKRPFWHIAIGKICTGLRGSDELQIRTRLLLKNAVFWDFLYPEDGGNTSLQNVG